MTDDEAWRIVAGTGIFALIAAAWPVIYSNARRLGYRTLRERPGANGLHEAPFERLTTLTIDEAVALVAAAALACAAAWALARASWQATFGGGTPVTAIGAGMTAMVLSASCIALRALWLRRRKRLANEEMGPWQKRKTR